MKEIPNPLDVMDDKKPKKFLALKAEFRKLMDNNFEFISEIKNDRLKWQMNFDLLKSELKNLMNDYTNLKKPHLVKYDEHLKQRKEISALQTSINNSEKEITQLSDKIKKTEKLMKTIIETEKTLASCHSKLEYVQKRIVDIRKRFLRSTMTRYQETIQKHLIYEFVQFFDYFDLVKSKTKRLGEKQIREICKSYSGKEFFEKLKNRQIESMDIKVSSTTAKKYYQLLEISNEDPAIGIRGLYSDKLNEILRAPLREKIKVSIKKNGKEIELLNTSPGEQQRNLLLMALIQNKFPLLIDQPEDNLDYEVKNLLPEYLKDSSQNRQLIVITHFPNIPVIGDAEKIFYLREKANSRIEVQEGAFESMAKYILKMEGGIDAIRKRKSRYDTIVQESKG